MADTRTTPDDTTSADTAPDRSDAGETDANGGGGPTEFKVRIENTSASDFYADPKPATGGQIWVTPGAYATYTGSSSPLFKTGSSASAGLQAVAEAGKPTGMSASAHGSLADELSGKDGVGTSGAWGPDATVADPNDPMGEVPGAGPIAPGGAFEFTVEAQAGEKLTFATMFVPSNDLFLAPTDGIALFENGSPIDKEVTSQLGLFDAGTEFNQKPAFGLQGAPLQKNNGGADAGKSTSENIRAIGEIDDGYEYPAAQKAVKVTVSPVN